jgi:hypothetical protein
VPLLHKRGAAAHLGHPMNHGLDLPSARSNSAARATLVGRSESMGDAIGPMGRRPAPRLPGCLEGCPGWGEETKRPR